MKKILFIISLFGILFLPFNIFADTINGKYSISCNNEQLKVNESTDCAIMLKIDSGIVSNIQTVINGENLEISQLAIDSAIPITYGELKNNVIAILVEGMNPGTYTIARFTIKSENTGSGTIKLTKNKIGDSDGTTNVENVTKVININDGNNNQGINPPDSNPDGNGTNNPNGNNNDIEQNPDTGSFISIIAIIGLLLSVISLISLKKLNKFNKI